METFTVSFFGHRHVSNFLAISKKVENIVLDLIRQKPYVCFLVGRDGDFDQIAASAVLHCKRHFRGDNSVLTWVMPYPTADFSLNEEAYRDYYDEIEVSEKASASHYKSSFQIRNRDMVDRSDLIIFCVKSKSGGAYQTMNYAQKHGKEIINL